jgi:hypothetical protein
MRQMVLKKAEREMSVRIAVEIRKGFLFNTGQLWRILFESTRYLAAQ